MAKTLYEFSYGRPQQAGPCRRFFINIHSFFRKIAQGHLTLLGACTEENFFLIVKWSRSVSEVHV